MFGGISIWQLLIVLVIVALIFGTKKLRGIGGDLGGAVKGFKKALDDESGEKPAVEDDSAASADAEKAETKEKQES